jgi:hypothetical protein
MSSTAFKDGPKRGEVVRMLNPENKPYPALVIVAAACLAALLMFWAMAGTSGPRVDAARNESQTTGRANPPASKEPAAPAQSAPTNDTAGDSSRASQRPQNKSQ